MFLGIANAISGIKSGGLSFIKDNLKLYLDFKSNRSDTLAFPSEGSTNFDGTNDYINFGDLNISFPFSLSLWVKPDVLEEGPIFGIGSIWSTHEMTIYQEGTGGAVRWRVNVGGSGGPGSNMAYQNGALTAGKWTHIAITADGTTGCMYIDGVRVGAGGSLSGTMFNSGQDNILGHQSGLGAQYFDGSMCNFGLWNRGLSYEEVQSIMNKSYSQLSSIEKTNLVSWWSLDEEVADSTQLLNQASVFYDADDWNNYGGGTFDDAGGTHIAVTAGSGSDYARGGYLYTYVAYMTGTSTNWYTGGRYRLISTTNSSINSTTSGLSLYGYRVNGTEDNLPQGSNIYDFTAPSNIASASFFRWHDMAQGETLTTTLEIYHLLAKDQHGSNNGRQYGTGITVGTQTLGSADSPTVYGGNAPVLPRAIDITESQAEAIGNGSALFNQSNTDYIEIKNTGLVLYDWTISFWVRTGANFSSSGYPGVVSTRSGANNDYTHGVTLHYFNDYFDAEGASQSGHATKVAGNTNLDNGEWHHVVYTCDRDGKNKQYINGIFITEKNAVDNPTNADTIQIGARFYGNSLHDYWDGNIAQVGIWQGVLSQSQMQSLMESTSYTKIPADVKSTLGSELVGDSTFSSDLSEDTNDSNWRVQLSGLTISDGRLRYSDSSIAYLYFKKSNSNISLPLNKLYKIVFTIFDNTATFAINTYNGSSLADALVSNAGYSVGTHTFYVTPTSTHDQIRLLVSSVSSSFSLDNISIKEVSNDIVGYWSLDSTFETSFVQDETTGETLGSNVLSNGDFASGDLTSWSPVSGGSAMSVVNNSLVHGVGNSGGLRQSVTLTSGALYKGTFDILEITEGNNDNTTTPITIYNYAGSSAKVASTEYGIQTNTFYFVPDDNGIWFEWGSGDGFTIDNFTLKKVTSNYGELK